MTPIALLNWKIAAMKTKMKEIKEKMPRGGLANAVGASLIQTGWVKYR